MARHPAPLRALKPTDPAPGRRDTVGDFIVEQIDAGVDPNYAAGTAGITAQEFQAWMRTGTQVFAGLNAGQDWSRDFTPDQQDCAVFADRALRSVSSHIARLAIVAEQLARGGLTTTETRERRTSTGQVVERTVVTKTALPDPNMLTWKLERLAPTVYGRNPTINLTVADLTDTDEEGEALRTHLLDLAKNLAIEASADG
jgi:hypothetical protein